MVTLTEVDLRSLHLIYPTNIHLRTKLADNYVRVVDLTTNHLAVAINAGHNIICEMQIST